MLAVTRGGRISRLLVVEPRGRLERRCRQQSRTLRGICRLIPRNVHTNR